MDETELLRCADFHSAEPPGKREFESVSRNLTFKRIGLPGRLASGSIGSTTFKNIQLPAPQAGAPDVHRSTYPSSPRRVRRAGIFQEGPPARRSSLPRHGVLGAQLGQFLNAEHGGPRRKSAPTAAVPENGRRGKALRPSPFQQHTDCHQRLAIFIEACARRPC